MALPFLVGQERQHIAVGLLINMQRLVDQFVFLPDARWLNPVTTGQFLLRDT